MSLNFSTQKIVIIVGAVVGITIILVIPYLIIRHVRRSEIASNMQKNNERLFREQEEQRGRIWAGDAGDLAAGIGTRGEALPSSEHAGNTHVNSFRGSRAIHTQPQAPTSVYMSNNRNIEPTRRPAPPNPQVSPIRPGRTGPSLNHPPSNTTSRHLPDYDSPSDLAQHQEDVPPAYSAVVPHR